ncbi:multicopper oxidase domain-containing protein [Rubrobacter marinus]|uniref:Multicopper oxidase domain-containing protein n=2 Tax=Rubrobacter marinus TaxID=2653852 RepID=A0A6G8Q2J9_9ACTN|nr:multicopper oxidase domain-containing protein [Rubrobacter marinus]
MLTRKDLLKLGLLGGAALFLPLERVARTQLASPRIPEDQIPTLLPPFERNLAYPPVLQPVGTRGLTDYYQITQRAANVEIVPGLQTQIYGYNGITPGPTIVQRRGRTTVVRQINALPETTVHPDQTYRTTTGTHLHGNASAPQFDGWAEDVTAPGEGKDYVYPNEQDARMLWYHDHAVHHTANNAYMGLAGLYVTRDEIEDRLPIPKGRYELPLVLKDLIVAEDGSLLFDNGGESSLFGDIVTVNGVPWPRVAVEPRKYTLRFLNASVSRGYNLALSTGDPFTVIGHDGGLDPSPNDVTSFRIGMAERYEVVVDFANRRGQQVVLRNLGLPNNVDFPQTDVVMRFDVGDTVTDPTNNEVPAQLNPSDHPFSPMNLTEQDAVRTRVFEFGRNGGLWTIGVDGGPGRIWDPNRVDANPALGDVEIWEFTNNSGGWFHPIHTHLIDFKILSRDGGSPHPYEGGPKDVAYVGEGETVRVIARFGPERGKYMMHCHNLVHEDHDMMTQFEVGSGGPDPESVPAVPVNRLGPLVPVLPPPPPPPANTAPVVTPLTPRPNSTIRGLRPTIAAVMRDAETDLAKANIKLWIDGRRVLGFTYARSSNRLAYRPPRPMRAGLHAVRITANDGRGRSTTKTWRFRIR